jgi:hypothetical protein
MLLQRREVIVLGAHPELELRSNAIHGRSTKKAAPRVSNRFSYWPHRLLRCYWQHPAPRDVSAGW